MQRKYKIVLERVVRVSIAANTRILEIIIQTVKNPKKSCDTFVRIGMLIGCLFRALTHLAINPQSHRRHSSHLLLRYPGQPRSVLEAACQPLTWCRDETAGLF